MLSEKYLNFLPFFRTASENGYMASFFLDFFPPFVLSIWPAATELRLHGETRHVSTLSFSKFVLQIITVGQIDFLTTFLLRKLPNPITRQLPRPHSKEEQLLLKH